MRDGPFLGRDHAFDDGDDVGGVLERLEELLAAGQVERAGDEAANGFDARGKLLRMLHLDRDVSCQGLLMTSERTPSRFTEAAM